MTVASDLLHKVADLFHTIADEIGQSEAKVDPPPPAPLPEPVAPAATEEPDSGGGSVDTPPPDVPAEAPKVFDVGTPSATLPQTPAP